MDLAELVNQPNMGHQEIGFEADTYIVHKWCEKWRSISEKKQHREPMLVRVNTGPIRCELCGRRASRLVRKIVENNSKAYKCQEQINCDEKEVTLRFYNFRRSDLSKEGLKSWQLNDRLLGELL